MNLAHGKQMAIQQSGKQQSGGQVLYEVIRARLGRLGSTDQITLGFAIQKGAPWPALSRQVRDAFDEVAEDLDLQV